MIATPRVTNVSERSTLDNRNVVTKAIVLTYYVGQHGPFTLVTSQMEIDSGAAAAKMQAFASSIAMLPGVAAT